MNFEQSLEYGKVGESIIAQWIKNRGCSVLPVYEIEEGQNKGPRLYTPEEDLVAPDILAFNSDGIIWIEAKHKTAFTWHRITKRWVTGIDLRHYFDYLKIANLYPYPVWLLFLQRGGKAKDSPNCSPSGLYGGNIKRLKNCENHRHENWGTSGMVYWSEKVLTPLATLEELGNMPTRRPA